MPTQLNLINDNPHFSKEVPGLFYKENYISKSDHDFLIEKIDQQPWLSDLKRRVQHYGYKYDYKARNIDRSAFLGPVPDWLDRIAQKLVQDNIFATAPDQIIVNEYLPGQSISAHIDCTPCFKEIIVSLSLGSSCIMALSNPETNEKMPLLLQERSLIVLSGDARYKWMHAIPARQSDIFDGIKYVRQRRISLTFRHVILTAPIP